MQPPTTKQAASLPEPTPTSFLRRLARVLGRLLLVVLTGIGLGLGAYYGLPALYTGFIQPVQINTRQIGEIESALEAQRQSDQARLEAIETRLTGLETELAAEREALGALQADLDSILTLLGSDRGDLQRVRDLETQLAALQSSLESTEARLTAVEGSLAQSSEPVDALQERLAARIERGMSAAPIAGTGRVSSTARFASIGNATHRGRGSTDLEAIGRR